MPSHIDSLLVSILAKYPSHSRRYASFRAEILIDYARALLVGKLSTCSM